MPNPFRTQVTTLGETIGRRRGIRFGVYRADRLFHHLILGQTGTGKSTLIANLIRQDINQHQGFCLIDPHGDLAGSLKEQLPRNAICWDIGDPDCQYGYNPLTYVSEEYRPLVASGIIDALKKQWSDAWGVRMEHLLRNAIFALLSRPNSSLADIVPMFTNKPFRREVLQKVTDTEVLKFWQDEYPKMNYRGAFDGVAPIANKLGGFLSHPVVRQALCEPAEPIRFRSLMDEGVPTIINLSKGRLGADVSEVLGGLILSMISNAAMTREDTKEHRRRPFMVYVDEFPTYTTETLANMLSELRKYRVGLILAGQYISGIKPSITEAIFGNVGNLTVFRVGATDAPFLALQLGTVTLDSLINLPNYRMFTKLMVEGVQTKAFSAVTINPAYAATERQ